MNKLLFAYKNYIRNESSEFFKDTMLRQFKRQCEHHFSMSVFLYEVDLDKLKELVNFAHTRKEEKLIKNIAIFIEKRIYQVRL